MTCFGCCRTGHIADTSKAFWIQAVIIKYFVDTTVGKRAWIVNAFNRAEDELRKRNRNGKKVVNGFRQGREVRYRPCEECSQELLRWEDAERWRPVTEEDVEGQVWKISLAAVEERQINKSKNWTRMRIGNNGIGGGVPFVRKSVH